MIRTLFTPSIASITSALARKIHQLEKAAERERDRAAAASARSAELDNKALVHRQEADRAQRVAGKFKALLA